MDKTYLLDLSKRGIPVIDSVMIESDKLTLDSASIVAQAKGWKDIVIKPSVGSGSRHCYRLTQVIIITTIITITIATYAAAAAAGTAATITTTVCDLSVLILRVL